MIFMFQMDAGTGEKHADWDAYLKERLAEDGYTAVLLPHFIKPLISMDVNEPVIEDIIEDDGDDYEEIYEEDE